MKMSTTQVLIHLPDQLVRRCKRRISVRQRSRFIQRLVEDALPLEVGGDDNPLYQAALALEKEHELASEMAEWRLPRSRTALAMARTPVSDPWRRSSAANRPAISGGSISIRARGGEIRKTRPAVVVTANIREDRDNTAAHNPNSIGLCLSSIRSWHAEYVLADIGEDQIGRDRGRLVEADLAPFALDVVFAGKGKAAIGRHRRLGGAPSRFGS